jgi:hypothetical protein
MNKSQLKELIKEEIRTALKEESKSKEFELEIINKNGTRTTQKVMADPSTTELFRIVAGIKKSPNVKDVRIKEEIRTALKEGDQFPPKSLLGIFTETADNNALYLDEADKIPFLKCMYAAYKMGSSNKTWK